jgi:hypothetical protein
LKKKLQSVAIFKKTPIFVMRKCSSAYCITLKKLFTTDCCMKKIGINIQLFLSFSTCNAVISKILFPSIFYIKKHVLAMNVLHNTRFLDVFNNQTNFKYSTAKKNIMKKNVMLKNLFQLPNHRTLMIISLWLLAIFTYLRAVQLLRT